MCLRNHYGVGHLLQKLELKSSKTRLLPSRSGVLIEFKSGVLIGYSRAIKGLKLNFSPK